MKTTEAYLDDYLDNYNLLKSKNELWRLKYTPQEFLKIVEQAKSRAVEDRVMGYLTEFHIQQNEINVIAVALQDKFTREEMKAQFDRFKKFEEASYKMEAPQVQKRISEIVSPLNFKDVVAIYKALFVKQITLEMIPAAVLPEFVKTRQYQSLKKRKLV